MQPKHNPVVSFVVNFLPGLVLGVVAGGLLGAFMSPIAESWPLRQPDPSPRHAVLASENR